LAPAHVSSSVFRHRLHRPVAGILDWTDYRVANGPWRRRGFPFHQRRRRSTLARLLILGVCVVGVVLLVRAFRSRDSRWI
jgi:hypothetical protein